MTFSTPALQTGSIEKIPAKPKSSHKPKSKVIPHAGLIALFAGLIFVSHPIQIEAVTNIWQRAASMAAFFYIASLCLYVKSRLLEESVIARSEATKQSFKKIASLPTVARNDTLIKFYYICSLITAIAAMFTKENTITLPLMVILYECCFFNTKKCLNWKSLVPFLATLLIIPVTSMIKTGAFHDYHGNLNRQGGIITPTHYFLTQLRVIVTYIRLAFIPVGQNFDYDYPVFKNIFELPLVLSFIFLMTILYFTKRLFLKYRFVSFSVCWFFLTLTIPESSFWPLGDVISEHRLYLPLAGYSMFLAGGLYYLLGRGGIRPMIIVLTMVLCLNSFLTYQRNKVWKDEFTLWGDTILKSPHKARPYSYLGSAYLDQGKIAQAIAEYTKAIEIDNNDVQAHNNRGNAYAKLGQFPQALADLDAVIAIAPSLPDPYFNRGLIYDKEAKLSQAILDYNKAIELNPDYVEAYANRGSTYAQEGKFTEALSDFNKVIEKDPDNAQAYYNIGLIYGEQSEYGQAIAEYGKAIDHDPGYAAAYNNRAVSCFQVKEYDNAWDDVHKARALGYTVNPGFINALSQVSGREQ